MKNNIESAVLNDKEAARYIGMSESWLRISRMRGEQTAPPFLKIGRSVRYLRQDLDIWLLKSRRINTLGQEFK